MLAATADPWLVRSELMEIKAILPAYQKAERIQPDPETAEVVGSERIRGEGTES